MTKIAETIMAGNLFILDWDQYANVLSREKAFQVIEEYTKTEDYYPVDVIVQKGYPDISPTGEVADGDMTYERRGILVEEFENPSKKLQEQFLAQLKDNGIETKYFDADLQESIEQAAVQSLENFNALNKTVIVKLSETDFVLASFASDDVKVKLISPVQGALVIFRPNIFVPFTLTKKAEAA